MTTILPLSNLIKWVDTRNKGVISTNLLGINIEKYFMPSVANVIGTDLSSYKVIGESYFACNPMHVGRDEKMPIALYDKKEPSIVSPAYFVFKVIDEQIINPEYLMLWFKRPEFDREVWFHTDGSVRGGITWEELLEMKIPVPSHDRQLEIVNQYKNIEKRISLLRQLNDNLVEIARATLLNAIASDNNPIFKSIDSICLEVKAGGTPSRANPKYWENGNIAWIKNGEVKNNIILSTEEMISEKGLKESSAKLVKKGSVLMAMYCVSIPQLAIANIDATTNQAVCAMTLKNELMSSYLYYYLMFLGQKLVNNANGSAQVNLSKEQISNYQIQILDIELLKSLNLDKNIKQRTLLLKEIDELYKLKNILISKLSH